MYSFKFTSKAVLHECVACTDCALLFSTLTCSWVTVLHGRIAYVGVLCGTLHTFMSAHCDVLVAGATTRSDGTRVCCVVWAGTTQRTKFYSPNTTWKSILTSSSLTKIFQRSIRHNLWFVCESCHNCNRIRTCLLSEDLATLWCGLNICTRT